MSVVRQKSELVETEVLETKHNVPHLTRFLGNMSELNVGIVAQVIAFNRHQFPLEAGHSDQLDALRLMRRCKCGRRTNNIVGSGVECFGHCQHVDSLPTECHLVAFLHSCRFQDLEVIVSFVDV